MRLSSINDPIWRDLRWLRWRTPNNEIEFSLTHSNCDCQQIDAFRIELDHFHRKNLTHTKWNKWKQCVFNAIHVRTEINSGKQKKNVKTELFDAFVCLNRLNKLTRRTQCSTEIFFSRDERDEYDPYSVCVVCVRVVIITSVLKRHTQTSLYDIVCDECAVYSG